LAVLLRSCTALAVTFVILLAAGAQAPSGKPADTADVEFVERLIVARRDYQKSLEVLRAHYLKAGDLERAKWAEEELIQFHRIPKQAFRLELDVPPPKLGSMANVTEANKLYTRGVSLKERGYGTDYIDNQRRAELLFQKILTEYPQSNKISDAAYQLGSIYESKAYKQYRRAAAYYERCFQWNPQTNHDARLKAARLYDRHLNERPRAVELYREITTHETDAKQIAEAQKRIADLAGTASR
jgi:tetratricopeptide (TPR) repeat protein